MGGRRGRTRNSVEGKELETEDEGRKKKIGRRDAETQRRKGRTLCMRFEGKSKSLTMFCSLVSDASVNALEAITVFNGVTDVQVAPAGLACSEFCFGE